MSTDMGSSLDELEIELASLERNVNGAAQMTSVFQQELAGMQRSMSLAEQEARGFSKSLSRGLRGAMGNLIFEGAKLSDVLESVAQRMIRTSFNQAMNPVTDAFSGWLTGGLTNVLGSIFPSANGNAFAGGRAMPFAQGGVVGGPTVFPMRGGQTGLMGEAGPEAIMPLRRGPDGKLGVAAQNGGGGVHVTMNISTPDADSFRRSQSQVAAGLSRAI
ncbi:MAG: phage tail tape measure protein, partial [Pseudomonadota bacterium]